MVAYFIMMQDLQQMVCLALHDPALLLQYSVQMSVASSGQIPVVIKVCFNINFHCFLFFLIYLDIVFLKLIWICWLGQMIFTIKV